VLVPPLPFRRRRLRSLADPRHREPACLSWRRPTVRSLVCNEVARFWSSRAKPWILAVPDRSCRHRSPETFASGSFCQRSEPLQSSFASCYSSDLSAGSAFLKVSTPLNGVNWASFHTAGGCRPDPPADPLSGFLNLSAVFAVPIFVALFHAPTVCGMSSFRVFPSQRSRCPLGSAGCLGYPPTCPVRCSRRLHARFHRLLRF
jgi:hypothetical protein